MRERRGLLSPKLFLVLWFVCGGILTANGAESPFSNAVQIQVTVSAQGKLRTLWRVRKAYFDETLTDTTGYLEVQNISDEVFRGGNLYAEYYDAAGRFCFSFVFSLDKNLAKRKGPFVPSETRTLYSTAVSLAPASEPKEVRIFLIKRSPADVADAGETPPMRAPVTIEVRIPGDPDKLWLDSGAESAEGPVSDLVLANVTVGRSGRIENVDVLGAASGELRSWFLKFVANQVFYTASAGGVPEAGNTLLLVRAVVPKERRSGSSFLPARASPWMANYVAAGADTPIPPITEIIFVRPPVKVKMGGTTNWTKLPVPPRGLFEPLTGSSDWCPGIFELVPDPASPDHFRRQLAGSPEM